ncbi:hypothetical protein PRZ48_013772 [Zasmidium cellare]|uniref:GDP/GTP exchange factor Sec2 N-terminal domain-containing protein n=1 Tax=Zasmidium cellare TaxID=395010 RepID=A0ABR0E2J2_ZASCE|nr:hypothetical protein PRZ48_013772 [Zasmidium cellare]
MAAVAGPMPPVNAMRDDIVMDTRTPSPVQRTQSTESNNDDDAYKPDLSAEVAMLSTKLVNAINYQTNLDDSLQHTRHELEQERQLRTTAEAEKARLDGMLSAGLLLKKADVDKTIAKLRGELASERAARDAAEKAKKQVEGELENLTSALFEEANTMVAAARKETEGVEKRNAQLKSQLQDTEMLLASQQEQLQDLKSTMEKLQAEATPTRDLSIPSTPVTNSTAVFDALQISPNATSTPDLPPEHPLHFSQLISPVLRNDITAYADFQDLLLLGRRMGLHSRTNSSNNTANQQSSSQNTYTMASASASSPNLPGSFAFANSSPSSSSPNMPALKESKFYKRALSEDIEPTLRLDLAPGLSFLSRRTVVGSLLNGTLAVEPYPQSKHYFACTLCGESKRGEPYVRKFRFRTSEDDNVSKPLCDYCVSRVRATCDFVGFLRMIRDGHWKCDSEEEQKSAWEEAVRLRERMFWARLGGGVVPCLQMAPKNVPATPSSAAGVKSARQSLESIPERKAAATESTIDGSADESTLSAEEHPKSVGQAFVNISSGAAAVSTPELQPTNEGATEDPRFITPPVSRGLDVQETDEVDAGALSPQPETPFEDANQQLEDSLAEAAAQADAKDVSNKQAVDEPAEDETRGVEAQVLAVEETESSKAPEAEKVESLRVPSPEQPETRSARSSLSVERPANHERKSSSVLARVRAMEQQQ